MHSGRWRVVRASLRDWRLLLSQFRWPLALLLVVTGVVAALFVRYYPQPLAYEDAFFAVLMLTVLQPVLPIPRTAGHWLIVFYFLMPLLGLVLAGQGFGNFMAMVFSRRERGQAWFEALASTYTGHVVVCGLGHIGGRVVESLLNAGSDVIGVEQASANAMTDRVRAQGVPVIEGDIRQVEVLRKAGVPRARSVVVCTNDDLANLQAALHCRELNPAARLVVRMFDAELARSVQGALGIERAFSASALVAPIFAGAALSVEVDRTFSIGDDVLSVGRVRVLAEGNLPGRTIADVENDYNCSIIVHERDGQRDLHPNNRLELQAGDQLLVLADIPSLNRLATDNQ